MSEKRNRNIVNFQFLCRGCFPGAVYSDRRHSYIPGFHPVMKDLTGYFHLVPEILHSFDQNFVLLL